MPKRRGYKKGRFSFNVKGGRCEACGGDGIIEDRDAFPCRMSMCPAKSAAASAITGRPWKSNIRDKSIYDVLNMTVEEAPALLREHVPCIRRKIQTLYDVGLSYIRLGQPSTELSGGEAQRIKLATELSSKRSTGQVRSISWMSPRRDFILQMWISLIEILQKTGRGRQYRRGHRAQPGRDQDGGLHHRHGTGRR